MSDEPVEDDDASSDADGASPAGSADPPSSDAADAEQSSNADETTDDRDRSDVDDAVNVGSDERRSTDADADERGTGDADGPDDSDGGAPDELDDEAPGSARARMGSRPPSDPADREAGSSSESSDDDSDADDANVDNHTEAPGTPDDRPDENGDRSDRSGPYDSGEADERGEAGSSAPRTSAHARDGAEGSGSSTDSASATATADADAGGGGSDGGGGGGGILSGGIGGSAPPDDEEMPLTEHIEEMLTRLGIVVVVAAFATLAAFPLANDFIIHMWYDVHYGTVEACKTAPQSGDCVAPHVYGPLELVLTRIRVAGLAGLLVALPLAVYQTYRFMRPGLYPHERRYFLAAVPFSLVLAVVGMVFAYFVLLPLLFAYFISYTQGTADLAFQLAETMNIILLMMGMLAVIFQIPLLIMLAIMMGITTRRWLERRRLYFWGLFLGVAFIFGPDPTGMAPFLLTATMVVLFEGTLLLLRWTGR